ncbi:MAG: hypothetical protein RIR77_1990, partial [Planctomycetota bacterium]
MIIRAALTLACASLISCAAATAPAPAPVAQVAPAATASAPAAPKTNAALEPLAFMTGAWTQAQANGAMIEEHWMAPRGSSMLGSFRRILGNG